MNEPVFTLHRVGREAQPVVVIDGFASDPDALRAAARRSTFEPAAHHYPGLRGVLPEPYVVQQSAVLAAILGPMFGRAGAVDVIDASFSIVTTPPGDLNVRQRLPHCDAFGADRIALVHYLSLGDGDGTAFFRHRSTGFETVDENRAPIFFGQLEAEMRLGGVPPASYVVDDTPLFERTLSVEALYNRALVYPSYLLHSGAIGPDAVLSPDPAKGRLTVTAFLSVGGA
ncbi:hypothetical protein HMP09_0577 [Sphingomonas sp. HMP9]|uniref:DUF6445 family protein n=1 Tax=Sphingomonas sp. HMP9 TaxID=1517554 RepID=UPI0015967973|nr:DUF6445 family protein [Sphingomonas sp. HMP9]BCA61343.1 hypothetical protein HMP09_0577 [Sphingomonas sp. HMP9]